MGTAKRERKKANRQQRQQELARQERTSRAVRRGVRIGVIALVVVGVVFVLSRTVGDDGDSSDDAATSTTIEATDTTVATETTVSGATTVAPPTTVPGATLTGPTPCPPAEGAKRTIGFAEAPPDCLEEGVTHFADVVTNLGEFTIELDAERAPIAANNFVVLARYGYFDGTQCHRAIPGFVVQCGDPTATGSGGPGYQFADELPEAGEYEIGSIAMANSGPNTNGSQFFVITGEEGAALPPNYTLFGEVVEDNKTLAFGAAFGAAIGVTLVIEVVRWVRNRRLERRLLGRDAATPTT